MNQQPNHRDNDLKDSLAKLFDDDLSDPEFEELSQRLREDPAMRALYFEAAALEISLDHVFAPPLSRTSRRTSRQTIINRKQATWATTIAAAAAVLIAAGLWITQIDPTPAASIGMRVCGNSQWTVNGVSEPGGHSLPLGAVLVLNQGVAELELPNGVTAILEAPAQVVLVDERAVRLDRGRGFFRVSSAEGHGFTVETSHHRIVDLGTAFGVHCQNGRDEVEIQVFEGHVRIDSPDDTTGEVIESGRAVLLRKTDPVLELERPFSTFIQQLPPKVETILVEDFESGLIAGRDYSVQMDSTAIRDFANNCFPGIDADSAWEFTTALPATSKIPVKSYVYDGLTRPEDQPSAHIPSGSPAGLFLDPNNTRLTDGHAGDSAGWLSATFVGFKKGTGFSNPQITFDLGTPHNIFEVSLTTHLSISGTPEGVQLSASADGRSFSAPIAMSPRFVGSGRQAATLNLSTWRAARYWRLKFSSEDEWMFLGEVGFTALSSAHKAEPSPASETGILELEPSLTGTDKTPPTAIDRNPAEGAENAVTCGPLTLTFDESIKFGAGRITLRNDDDWREHEIVVGSSQTRIENRTLSIMPPVDLVDGTQGMSQLCDWQGGGWIGLFNPLGDGTRYTGQDFEDRGSSRGMIGAMRGPVAADLGSLSDGVRRMCGEIAVDTRYMASVAIGVRDPGATQQSDFLGYTIRLTSGGVTLAETGSDRPPGPPNSFTSVGVSWCSSSLPEGVEIGDPLVIEVRPNQATGLGPGYLDIDHVRVSIFGH